MNIDWDAVPPAMLEFWTGRRLATLTTLRADGSPHVVPVGVTLDLERRCAWVITGESSRKARHLAAGGPVAVCQVDGAQWVTIEGTGTVHGDEESVARAVELYAARYRQPRENPHRVAIRVEVARLLCSTGLR